jgi:ABC-type nitrate/sulfonate/bicarbonate transport system permease component
MQYPVLFLALLLLFWEGAVKIRHVPDWILPAPSQVGQALYASFPLLVHHTLYTLLAAGAGFLLAILVAALLAALMDLSPVIRKGLYPFLIVSQTVPIISIAPLLVIWFGYGLLPKVLVVALVCFFPVAIAVVDGMSMANPEMVALLRTMGASPWQILWKLRVPSALPNFFSGLKVAATYSVMGAVIGEWLGASNGLGIFMTRASKSFLVDRVFATILVITILSVSIFALIELMAKWLMPWQRSHKND